MIRFFKFSLAGIANTIVDWTTFFWLKNFVLDEGAELFSKIGGILTGIISAYLINIFWVFRTEFLCFYSKSDLHSYRINLCLRLFFKFLLTYSAGMLINFGVFAGLRHINTFEFPSLLLASTCSFLFNYMFVKNVILTTNK